MSNNSGLPVIFGAGPFHDSSFWSQKDLLTVLDVLSAHGVRKIDTAQLYGPSETELGAVQAGRCFVIDTKEFGGWHGGEATRAGITKRAKDSIREKLKVDKVDIFYLHAPDRQTPLEETLAGVNDVFELGLFERFGLSNFTPDEVEQVVQLCREKGWVMPSVYQGNYSAVARNYETTLFPALKKYGISFYAYSPLAGGFLVKSKQQILDGAGRFHQGHFYSAMYAKDSYLEALAEWEDIAKQAGCSRADLAYRWVAFNSPLKKENGDAFVVGASRVEQLEQTLKGLEAGPLSQEISDRIEAIWSKIKKDAPVDNFDAVTGGN